MSEATSGASVAFNPDIASLIRATMYHETHHRSLATRNARAMTKMLALKSEGARECRAPSAPAASCAKDGGRNAHEYSQRGHRKSPGIPARNGVNGCFVLSPEIGLCCLRRLAELSARLGASVEASGPHDLAVRKQGALVRSAARVHRISSRVRDDRDTPLMWDETAVDMPVIWVHAKRKCFLLWDSTAQITPNLARRARGFLQQSA
jgi:hypothetical protein